MLEKVLIAAAVSGAIMAILGVSHLIFKKIRSRTASGVGFWLLSIGGLLILSGVFGSFIFAERIEDSQFLHQYGTLVQTFLPAIVNYWPDDQMNMDAELRREGVPIAKRITGKIILCNWDGTRYRLDSFGPGIS